MNDVNACPNSILLQLKDQNRYLTFFLNIAINTKLVLIFLKEWLYKNWKNEIIKKVTSHANYLVCCVIVENCF